MTRGTGFRDVRTDDPRRAYVWVNAIALVVFGVAFIALVIDSAPIFPHTVVAGMATATAALGLRSAMKGPGA